MSDTAFQRIWLDSMLTLPAPVLRVLSGGGSRHRGERSLDPTFQYLASAWRHRAGAGDRTPESARRSWDHLVKAAGPRGSCDVRTEEIEVAGATGPLRARYHRPDFIRADAPLLLFLHDGGGVAGTPELADGLLAQLAEVAACPILAPAYRLAPEHRYPAGLEDARAAYDWCEDKADALGGQGVAVAGQSLGAGFAATICQTLKVEDRPQPALQLLICPILDAAGDCQSLRTFADAWPLSRERLEWLIDCCLSPGDDPSDPRISPFRTPDARGLAPALIITAGFDPVADQGELYARKLKAAGVPVVHRCYQALPHAFPAFAGVARSAEIACREIGGLLRDALSGGLARACCLGDRTEAALSLVL